MTISIETPRLRLRLPAPTDAPQLASLLNNFAVAGNLAMVPHPYTVENAEAWLSHARFQRSPRSAQFVIDVEYEGPVGVIGFTPRNGAPNIGYWLGQPYWGRGLMTEAARAAIDWFYTETPDDVIVSGAFHFNMASLTIQHKLGFVETGRSLRYSLAREEDVEHIDTELTREAFTELGGESLKVAAP